MVVGGRGAWRRRGGAAPLRLALPFASRLIDTQMPAPCAIRRREDVMPARMPYAARMGKVSMY